MAVRDFEDLVCWQLANELKIKVYASVDPSSAKTDFRFRDQIRASASSAPSNIAEGFAYYRHAESARYARTARSSLAETRNHLVDGIDRCYWTKEQIEPLLHLANRASGATMKWIQYLMSTEAPRSRWQQK